MNREEKILEDFHGNPLEITSEELPKIGKKLQIRLTMLKVPKLRVEVVGGGCAGLSYDIKTEEENVINDDDIILLQKPLVVSDTISIKYLAGATIDWFEDAFGKRIEIFNPHVKQTCGCKNSFSIE